MLDSWFRDEGQFWDAFYRDRDKGVPFFIEAPDENLATWVEEGRLPSGRVLELGCGPGRNAVYLASEDALSMLLTCRQLPSNGRTTCANTRPVYQLAVRIDHRYGI